MPETFDFATADPGSGGANLAGDAVAQGAGVFLPACYLVYGPDGGPYARVDAGAGLPVAVQGTVPVSGTVGVSGTVAVAGVVAVSGTVPVSGTFWQTTQPVSGPLTDAQLRATAVPVSGSFWQATQPVSGPLTDAQLRASAVPVSLTAVPSHAVTNAGTFAVQVTSAPTTAVTAAALPLPAGASTEATLAALNTATGAQADAAAATDAGSFSLMAFVKRLLSRLTTLMGQLPSALVGGRLDVNLGACPVTVAVDSELPAAAALADGAFNPTAPAVGAFSMLWDAGAGLWQRDPANQEVVLLASAARTTTTTTGPQTNRGHRGIVVVVNVTAIAAGSIGVTLLAVDPISGNSVVAATGSTLTATGTYMVQVCPGSTTTHPVAPNTNYGGLLPTTWRVQFSHSDGTSKTYSAAAMLLR